MIKSMESVLEFIEHPERFDIVKRYVGKGKHKVEISTFHRKPLMFRIVGGTDV